MQEINILTMAFLWHTMTGQKQNAGWAGLAVLAGSSNFCIFLQTPHQVDMKSINQY